MINYVPERIYAKIKDDPSFIEIDKLAKDRFSKSGTLLDVVMFDNNIKEDDFIYKQYNDTLYALVKKYCPEYELQMKITLDNDMTKNDLLYYYDHRSEYDTETVLYILSYLINTSYQDYTFNTYQKQYHELYEAQDLKTKYQFSTYIHLKYINSKVEDYAINEAPKDETYLTKVFGLLTSLYDEYKLIIKDQDLLKYVFIEIFDHTLTNAYNFVDNDKLIYKQLPNISVPEDILDGDFKGTSINELGILDKKFELAFAVRNWEETTRYYYEILEWIDNALSEPQKLFKTLVIYDKVMAPNFCGILRRYVKLSTQILCKSGDPYLRNLNPQDQEFILRKSYSGTKFSNQATTDSFNRLTNHIDQWFANNEVALTVYKNWYYNIRGKEDVFLS
jgi:hypothetical protein|nr:MAG TPA: hypothetical protein [Caudoviricetes sp.]